MKHLKILGLAAVAAAALMAFAGAGTATADELCSEAPTGSMCPGTSHITTITASQVGTRALTTTGGAALVECTGGDIHITISSDGTGTSDVGGTVNSLGFTGCNHTVTTIQPGTATASHGANGGTTLSSSGGEVTTAILGVSCTYGTGASTDLGEVNTNGEISFSVGVTKTAGSGLCPATATWDGVWQVTSVTHVHYLTN